MGFTDDKDQCALQTTNTAFSISWEPSSCAPSFQSPALPVKRKSWGRISCVGSVLCKLPLTTAAGTAELWSQHHWHTCWVGSHDNSCTHKPFIYDDMKFPFVLDPIASACVLHKILKYSNGTYTSTCSVKCIPAY